MSDETLDRLRKVLSKVKRDRARAKAKEKKKPRTKVSLEVVPCAFASEVTGKQRADLKLDHRKHWNWCSHPRRPLKKDVVCPCEGCGPNCTGYET